MRPPRGDGEARGFLTAEGLTAGPRRLPTLGRELELDEPLREEYRLFKNTGDSGEGDTSATIRSGRIVRDRDDRDETPIAIPGDRFDAPRSPGGMPGGLLRYARPGPRGS